MKNVFILFLLFPFFMTAQEKDSFFETGGDELEKGNYEKAIRLFEKAIKNNDSPDLAYFNKALCEAKLMKFEKATEAFSKVAEISENKNLKVEAMYSACFIQRNNLRDFEGALASANKGIEIDSTDYRAFYMRGQLYYDVNQYEKAIESFDFALDLKKSESDIYFKRVMSKRYLDQYKAAIEDYNKTIELDSTHKEVYFSRAYAYMLIEKYEESIKDFDESIKMTHSPYAYNNRGYAKYKLGQFKAAKEDCEMSISIDPENGLAHYYLGLILYELGDTKKACKTFKKANKFKGMDLEEEIKEKCK